MSILKSTLALAFAASTLAASGTVVQAAPRAMQLDLPILVDLHYELKNPAGPVTATQAPDELKDPHVVLTAPVVDIYDVPHPQWEQQVILQR